MIQRLQASTTAEFPRSRDAGRPNPVSCKEPMKRGGGRDCKVSQNARPLRGGQNIEVDWHGG
jgi:hypothetical protein